MSLALPEPHSHWPAGRASDACVEHLAVSHRRGSQWSSEQRAGRTAMRTKKGQNKGNSPLYSSNPAARGFSWSRTEKDFNSHLDAAPGRISPPSTIRNPSPGRVEHLAMVDSPTMRKTFVVPEIKPPDLYDCAKAKICASVGWLLAKSYGTAENVPAELRDPFYCDQYEQEHLKPPVTRLLQSSELYCRTYSLLLGGAEAEAQPKDNIAMLELLTQKGIVSKDKDTLVTDADLRRKPIKMSAHLAVIDALMTAGAMEAVAAVKTSGSAELLGGAASWEEALLHWVNGLNQKMRELTEGPQNDSSQATEPQPLQPSLRYRKDRNSVQTNGHLPSDLKMFV
ncbi:unnamed protein product [Pleuronectes platessa]|uniref:CASAMP N-terminal domain-containing protein n=1 Tax=Pleuronectes platessa TaxID=8262 RepID=A0A9N7VI38_PLEPL|nr:unnamed protein product [Pleuronectes platessa]